MKLTEAQCERLAEEVCDTSIGPSLPEEWHQWVTQSGMESFDRIGIDFPPIMIVNDQPVYPVTERTLAILKRRIAECEGRLLFPHRQDPNRPLTKMQRAHLLAMKSSGIRQRFRLCDLRHTFGSRSAMAGLDLSTLKELVGHSDLSTTMRYVHPPPEHKRAAVEKLERFNAGQVIQMHEQRAGYPQIPPQ